MSDKTAEGKQPFSLEIYPLTPDRWNDLETLFGKRGAVGGCWCMFWRLPNALFEQLKGDGNRQAFQSIVHAGEPTGVIAYVDGVPAGWCAVAPRDVYTRLERSRILKPVDEQPVWSIPCFFIARPFRRQGLMVNLIRAAIEYARSRGARIVEAYPVEARRDDSPDVYMYTGLASAFLQAGFREAARRSETRPIMRYEISI
jgi:GNAT superfamily N-acetyltransferase